MQKGTKLTEHASARLIERTSLSPQALCAILDGGAFVSLGKEVGNTKISKLFFSKSDDQFFVAIQDQKNGEVVTVLTIEYWQNLSEKHFETNLYVSRNDLLEAISMVDPSNKVLKHSPLTGSKSRALEFVLVINETSMSNGSRYQKYIRLGSFPINLLDEASTEDLAGVLRLKFIEVVSRREVQEKSLQLFLHGFKA